MKLSTHIIAIVTLVLLSFTMQAQQQAAPSKYVVFFRDKNNSPYSLNNPQQYLSQRALDRRTRFNIAIDERDLPVNPQYVTGVQNTGVVVLNKQKWLNSITIWVPDTAVLQQIAALPYVQSISTIALRKKNNENPIKDFKRDIPEKVRGKSTAKSTQTTFDYGLGTNQIAMFNGQVLHQQGYMGQGMVIAVLDAGFSSANTLDIFDSMYVNNRLLGTKDFVNPGNSDVYQFSTHGTYVLSCMGGNINGQLVGTAPMASYWLLRSEEGATEFIIEEYNWGSAAEFADSVGADIINSSLGYTRFDDSTQNHVYAVDLDGNTAPSTRAADVAAAKGILVVNSAGNSGTSSWFYIGAPADADSILTVGAVDSLRQYVDFSSKGPAADGRIKPNVAARGRNAWVVSLSNGVMPASGTSFSSPIMAGAVACFWQANPTFNNMQIIDAIQKSASQFNNPDSLLGYGIPDFAVAGQFLPTGLDNLDAKDEIINIFPNPFTNTFNVVFRPIKSKDVDVTVTDVAGKKVFSKSYPVTPGQANTLVLEGLENAPQGQYIVTVKAGKQRITKKAIKE